MIQAATSQTQPNVQQEYIHRAAWKAGVLGAINVLIQVVAVRIIVLLSIAGAAFLAAMAINNPDPWRMGVLAIYSISVVIPSIWLASRH